VKDLLGFRGTVKGFPVERLEQLARRFSRSGTGMSVRGLRMNRFNEEVELIRQLYNSAWEKNWGFVPMTDAEVDHMAKQLKPVVDPELALIGEINGEPIGFALALPDVNQAIRHLNGRLFPFGSAKLLWHMKRRNTARPGWPRSSTLRSSSAPCAEGILGEKALGYWKTTCRCWAERRR
jgi:hypothetical protein